MAEPFHKRFDIAIPADEAQRRFRNRVRNLTLQVVGIIKEREMNLGPILHSLKTRLGEEHTGLYPDTASNLMKHWDALVENDFWKCLHVTEELYTVLSHKRKDHAHVFADAVRLAVQSSEIDLEVRWENGVFAKTGAQSLDDALVNEPLRWLRYPGYENAVKPFEKGLRHWMEAHNRGNVVEML